MYSIHQVVNNQPTQCGYYIFEVLDQPVRNEGVRGRWRKKMGWDFTKSEKYVFKRVLPSSLPFGIAFNTIIAKIRVCCFIWILFDSTHICISGKE